MNKKLITSFTAFAIVLSAGMSVAGPLRDHGQCGFTRETLKTAAKRNSKYKTAHMYYDAAKTNFADASTGSNWSPELLNVVVITTSNDGNYTWIFGKTTGSNLSDQLIWMNYR